MHQDSYHWYRPEGFGSDSNTDPHSTSFSDTNLPESLSCTRTRSGHIPFFFSQHKLACVLLGIVLILALLAWVSTLGHGADSPPFTSSLLPNSGSSWDDAANGGSFENDYKLFFDRLYGSSSVSSGANSLPTAAGDPTVSLAPVSGPGGEAPALTTLYTQCSPSVVSVSAFLDDGTHAWGSGVLLSSDGYLVTNNHIIEHSVTAEVTLSDDRTYDAALVGYDVQTDLAVLKIDAEGLTPAVFGDSDALQIGEAVAAIGNPLGPEYRNTLTDGIISAMGREISSNGYSMLLLQTNTAINEGNSGGPLFNAYGQVIGITNMKIISPTSGVEGIGFSIPASTVIEVVNTLMQTGHVARPSLGITLGPVPEDAAEYYKIPQGLYITAVQEASDAYAAGLRPGDILTAVNGTPVTTTEEVLEIRNAYQIGDSLTMTLFRDGRTIDTDVKIYDAGAVQ